MTPRKPTRAKQLGVSDAEYARLLAAQGGHCALCPNVPKRLKKDGTPYRLHVDHDHATNRVRGLLCWKCNDALPTWVTADWLIRAAEYLEPVDVERLTAGGRFATEVRGVRVDDWRTAAERASRDPRTA